MMFCDVSISTNKTGWGFEESVLSVYPLTLHMLNGAPHEQQTEFDM